MRKTIITLVAILATSMFTACQTVDNANVASVSNSDAVITVANEQYASESVPTTYVDEVTNEKAEAPANGQVVAEAPQAINANYEPDNPIQVDENSVIDVTDEGIYPTTAYNFTDAMTTGSTTTTEDSIISFPYEGRFGIDAYTEGKTVYLKAYSNVGTNPRISSVELTGHDNTIDLTGEINYNDYYALDLTGFAGVRKLSTTFVVNGIKITNKLIIYIDTDEAWLCELTALSVDDFNARQDRFNTIMSDLNFTPENQLEIDEITYPRAPVDGARCDTQRWADLSEEIITNPNWSDGRKVVMLHDWICNNIAYDRYRTNVIHTSRDIYHHDYSGTYSVWNTRTGVCGDVSNIFVIMCRHNGIPCMTCEDGVNHQWVAVYINDEWYEMDLTQDMYRITMNSDVNDITIRDALTYNYTNMSSELYSINNRLWTYSIDMNYSYGNYDWYFN